MAVVNELVTKFSFVGSLLPMSLFNKGLGAGVLRLGRMAAGLAVAAGAFEYWASTVLRGVDAVDALGDRLDIPVAKIQELNYMAGQTQSSAGAMQSSLLALNRTIGQAAFKGSEDFARLGISIRYANGQIKSADTILGEVGQRFREMRLSRPEQESFASALGIDASLLQLLNKSSTAMGRLRDEARTFGVLTEAQSEQAADYARSSNRLWFSLNSLQQLIAVGLAPGMRDMSDRFTQLIADNKEWIISGVKLTAEWMGKLWESLKRTLPMFGPLVAGFIALKAVLLGIGKIGWIAVLTGLYFILDDLIVAFRGGKSVIADFFKDTFDVDIVVEITAVMRTLRDVFLDLNDFGTDLGKGLFRVVDNLSEIPGLLSNITAPGEALGKWLFDITERARTLKAELADLIDAIAAPGAAFGKWLFEVTHEAPALELPKMPDSEIRVSLPEMPTSNAAVSAPEMQGLVYGSPTINTGSSTVNQDNQVNIYTTDSQAAGEAVVDSLQRQLDTAGAHLGSGRNGGATRGPR